MSRRTFSWTITFFVIGSLVFIANDLYAQEGMMKCKPGKCMLSHKCCSGEKHHKEMGHMGMMHGEHQGGHGFLLGMHEKLGLSADQISKLKTLKSEAEKQMIRTKADLRILQIELHDLLQKDEVNVKAVDSKIEKIGKLQTEMHKANIHAKLDAQKVLTPEQLKKLHEPKGKGRQKKLMREKSLE